MAQLRRPILAALIAVLSLACGKERAAPPAAPIDAAGADAAPRDPARAARALLELWLKGDDAAVVARFGPELKAKLDAARLGQAREQVLGAFGAFQAVTDAKVERKGGLELVTLTCTFAASPAEVRVGFGADGAVFAFAVTAAKKVVVSPPPDYAPADALRERSVTVGSGDWALPGKLTLPVGAGPFPCVVLVHGSGPQDMDETIGGNRPFRDLAWGLAARGVAVLRYDKRTFAHGARMAGIAATITTKEEVVDDAVAALALARSTPEIDPRRVILAGHSLGGLCAPAIARRELDAGNRLAGVIILAGPTRHFADIIVDQVRYLAKQSGVPEELYRPQVEKIEQQAAKAKDPALSPSTPATELPLGMPAVYWLDLRTYTPAATAAALGLPLLILRGERDYQVTEEDTAGWRKALGGRKDVEIKTYPKLNHLFVAGEGAPNPQEYEAVGHVERQVVEDIAAWVKVR
jgi:uncharacterized protein